MASLDEIERFLNIDTDDKILYKGRRRANKNRYIKYRGQYYIIKLTKDKWMIMDDSDLTRELLEDHVFCCGVSDYAVTNINKKTVGIHRLITECDDDNVPDHINRKGFDNRSINLCEGTQKDNTKNKSIPSNNTTGKIGVSRSKIGKYYYYTGYITDNNGERQQKTFSVSKFGEAGAKRRAIQHRKAMEIMYGYLGE
jgi:hypothetical protein